LGIQGGELGDELWVDLANGINVEEAWVLESLKNVVVDVVEIGDIFLVIVLLSEGDVGVGVVSSGGGNVELGGGGKKVVLRSYDACVSILVIPIKVYRSDLRCGGGRRNIQGLYSFYTYVLPKAGYPAVVLYVDVPSPTRKGEGDEGGRGRVRSGIGGMGVGGGSGQQGWVGGERRPASPWESGIGYGLEGGRVHGGVNLTPLGVGWLDVVMIVEEEGRGGAGGAVAGVGVGRVSGDDGDRGGRRGERSLSFRLKTGRSPKSRMHLTEGQTGNSGNVQVVSEQGDDGTGGGGKKKPSAKKETD
jgi:hypothetical protein